MTKVLTCAHSFHLDAKDLGTRQPYGGTFVRTVPLVFTITLLSKANRDSKRHEQSFDDRSEPAMKAF